jgi:hypothetical protein
MAVTPPGVPVPPVGPLPPRRRPWLTATIAALAVLCICCLLSLALAYQYAGDPIVGTLCRIVPGLFQARTCEAVGVPPQ